MRRKRQRREEDPTLESLMPQLASTMVEWVDRKGCTRKTRVIDLVARDLDLSLQKGSLEEQLVKVIPPTKRSLAILRDPASYFWHELKAGDRVVWKNTKGAMYYGILLREEGKWKVMPVYYHANEDGVFGDGKPFLAWNMRASGCVYKSASSLKRLSPLDPVAFMDEDDGVVIG